MVTYLFNRTVFLSWKNYSIRKLVDEVGTPPETEGNEQIDEENS